MLPPIPLVIIVTVIAAIAGDQVGYWFGKKVGPALFDRPKSKLFNPSHVVRAHTFLEKYGNRTIVLARFVPIVRTFAPVVAGVGGMEYKTFVKYNVLGGIAWGAGLPLLGFLLGRVDVVKDHIEIAILAVVFISLLPVVFEYISHRRSQNAPK